MFVDLSSCVYGLSSWYFGPAHSLEKVMRNISRLRGAGVYILNFYTFGVLNKRPATARHVHAMLAIKAF